MCVLHGQQPIGLSAFYPGCLADSVLSWMSCQCRLEANYAHQQELDMIPLMMQKDYKPQGWRKPQPIALCVVCPYVAIVMR